VSRGPNATLIDLLHLGRERAIGCWDLGGVLVDPGPESCLETLLASLDTEPRALLLTHIHLDHAGASGALVERFPALEVWVHSNGAPHLADPAKLVSSAERLYGDDMKRLWGAVRPVPERNLRRLEGGETISLNDRRVEVTYAPGHASHHVVYFDPADRTAYVGDVAGVRIPPCELILAPTPPPDVDLEAWGRSLELVRAMRPARLALTHFGSVEACDAHLDGMLDSLLLQARSAKALLEEVDEGGEEVALQSFVADVVARIDRTCDPRTAAVHKQTAPPDQIWLGLARYWKKRKAAERTAR
jgi:glyoxylase-like metal-dependent hydrolase (beta-lactamase superfamily II)